MREKLTKECERLLNDVFVRNGTVIPSYEQLVEEIRQLNSKETHTLWTGVILSLMREEIKKVRSENPYSADEDTDEFFAFDLACAKILKKMEEK